MMAKKLVYACMDGAVEEPEIRAVGVSGTELNSEHYVPSKAAPGPP